MLKWLKHAYQRIRYGFSYRDVWAIDYWFLKVMPKMLRELAKTTHGYPSSMFLDEDKEKLDLKELNTERMSRWRNTLNDMATHFERADDLNDNTYINEYADDLDNITEQYGLLKLMCKNDNEKLELMGKEKYDRYQEIHDKWFKRNLEINREREEELKKGLEMFCKYFRDLWD